MARALRLLAMMLFVLATAGPSVIAQSAQDAILAGARNSKFDPFGLRRAENAQPQRAPRTYQPTRRYTSRTAPAADVRPSQNAASAAPPEASGPPQTIAVIGDSLAESLSGGLELLYENRPNIRVLRRVRGSSGLVRDDFYDWNKGLQEFLESNPKPDALVIVIGLNDRQPLRDETGAHEPFTEAWRIAYIRRIDRMIEQVATRRIPLFWVGLPIMRSEKLTADAVALNEMFRDRAPRQGGSYVDVWEAFATEQGQYSATGPDPDGEVTRLRNSDGIHFSEAGARKLAFFVDRALQKIINRTPGAEEAAVAAALPDINEQIRRENERARGPDIALPINPTEGLIIPILPVRPLAGEVRRLTVAPLSADSRLVERRSSHKDPVIELVFTRGAPPFSKPGRADDFTWGRRN